ncbi:hypothetical protein GGR51DRAFT_558780 [Nemania sp. FL0031]|nr:hypothetical protein GGR51DRAFT_558780 [Nemania sp. FL0031]
MSRRLIYLPTESEDEDELIMEELDDRSRSESPPTAINRTQMGRRPALPPTPDSTSLQPAPTGRTMNHEAREAYYAGNHSRAQDPETVGSQRSSPHESSTGSDLALVPSRTHRSPPIPEFSDLPRLDDIDSGYEADVSGNTGNSDSRFRRRYSGVRNRRIGFRRRFSNGVDCVQRRPPQRLRGSGPKQGRYGGDKWPLLTSQLTASA